MVYGLRLHPAAAADLYKLAKRNKPLGKVILEHHFNKILTHPYTAGRKKTGDLAHIYGYNFVFRGITYRILYEIKEKTVRIIAAGVHDAAYRKARRRTT